MLFPASLLFAVENREDRREAGNIENFFDARLHAVKQEFSSAGHHSFLYAQKYTQARTADIAQFAAIEVNQLNFLFE